MLIQELALQDYIKYSRGVKIYGSCLDRVVLEMKIDKKTKIYVCLVLFRSCVRIV